MFGTIKQLARGHAILSEWFGAGGNPVPVLVAETRGATCSTCPNNVHGNWLDRLKKEAADVIKEHLTVKDGLGLTLSSESRLGFCSKCGCCLSLKCWVPVEHVMAHTPANEILEYPSFCWIRRELTAG